MDRIAALNDILTENPKDAFARYGLAMEHVAHGQCVGDLGDVMDAQDGRARVRRPQRCGHRCADALVRRPAGDGPQEVLA